jgi:hypothetical protein
MAASLPSCGGPAIGSDLAREIDDVELRVFKLPSQAASKPIVCDPNATFQDF